jgi:hypothetical protein
MQSLASDAAQLGWLGQLNNTPTEPSTIMRDELIFFRTRDEMTN